MQHLETLYSISTRGDCWTDIGRKSDEAKYPEYVLSKIIIACYLVGVLFIHFKDLYML
jgi:hypothetical protein